MKESFVLTPDQEIQLAELREGKRKLEIQINKLKARINDLNESMEPIVIPAITPSKQ
jgi:hypothetical protein